MSRPATKKFRQLLKRWLIKADPLTPCDASWSWYTYNNGVVFCTCINKANDDCEIHGIARANEK